MGSVIKNFYFLQFKGEVLKKIKAKGIAKKTGFAKIGLCFVLVFLTLSCSSPLKPKSVFNSKAKIKGVYHKVKKGETLWRIAKTYNVDLKQLKQINYITDVQEIRIGRNLFIPGARKRLNVDIYKSPIKKVSLERNRPSATKKGFIVWPIKGTLTSRFGMRKNQKHDGIDIAAPKGSPIFAAASGKIIFSGWGPSGYGKMVIIKHNKKWVTVYAHNSKNSVKKDQWVKKGEKIAYIGRTGRASGPHLHFELRGYREPVNPLIYLR